MPPSLDPRHTDEAVLIARGVVAATLSVAALAMASSVSGASAEPWPGADAQVADHDGELGSNVSGLATGDASRLWAVRDDPGELLLLVLDGDRYEPDGDRGDGRELRWPDGTGAPDAEAVTVAADRPDVVYVAAERDNDEPGTSRQAVLEIPIDGAADDGAADDGAADDDGDLVATRSWDLTSVLPATEANTGIEGLAWVPDDALVAGGFTEASGAVYDPAAHPGHGTGVFVVGSEDGGALHVLALGDGGVELLAAVPSGLDAVMEVAWDADGGRLWAACDEHCDGRITQLVLDGTGSFVVDRVIEPPAGLDTLNDEGLAIGACAAGEAWVVWADDEADDGHVLRRAALTCTATAAVGSAADSAEVVPDGGSGSTILMGAVVAVIAVAAVVASRRGRRR